VDSTATAPLLRGTYRATISGVGRPGPIEERVGRRLIRVVDPSSREGLSLARSGRVMWLGPEGEALGRLDLTSVRRLLHERFERRLVASAGEGHDILRDGMARLNASSRLGRA
jgi:hypothetical protein